MAGYNKVKKLVASELVNVAAGLLDAHRYLKAAVEQIHATNGQPVAGVDLTDTIRPMSFSDTLGSDMLVLSEREIDALGTLRSNTAITRRTMFAIMDTHESLSLLLAGNLSNSVAHDMEILAEAFAEFAPDRKLALPGKQPESATELLRRLAADLKYPPKKA